MSYIERVLRGELREARVALEVRTAQLAAEQARVQELEMILGDELRADDYQAFTRTTAIYQENLGSGRRCQEAITYCTLGLCGEIGEIAEKMKKKIRGGGNVADFIHDPEMAKELGDVAWYLARLADELDLRLSDVLAMNVEKLSSRKARGKLHGEGDNR